MFFLKVCLPDVCRPQLALTHRWSGSRRLVPLCDCWYGLAHSGQLKDTRKCQFIGLYYCFNLPDGFPDNKVVNVWAAYISGVWDITHDFIVGVTLHPMLFTLHHSLVLECYIINYYNSVLFIWYILVLLYILKLSIFGIVAKFTFRQ